ncbi:hypothetical protein HYH03_000245 [Edaphochlamys debaryana]|uniref:GPI inositol-deacylase n=1 Tax=Edaphochlamys debaryana TaxID=47281 RepID=A0A836C6B8_9CHLO|nr:hypothetical protein HYH03_000245 [Edaphochlamys debaryana]|eukprot:KAG2501745.1 hypothetical protein HYH03_000245 [Edaphochlamys debaryana]
MSLANASRAQPSRWRRWAGLSLGAVAGVGLLESQLHDEAQKHGQTTGAYAKDRIFEVAATVRNATTVTGSLAGTAVSSAVDAVKQRRFDSGHFNAAMAGTAADLASDGPSRQQLVAMGGGYLLDWLLTLAYPDPHGDPHGPDGEAEAPLAEGAAAAAAAARVAARSSRQAERAVENLLWDDATASIVLDRPGAVPRLLRAMADGRASSGVAAAVARRAAEPRVAGEAMTADLRETVDVLRGSGSVSMALQRTAAGLLAAWAAGDASNRAKLTGLGLQGVLAEVATAVSGMGDRTAVELQWELLRLMRVMAEHSSAADSHHLARIVLPLLYTAADAAAEHDALMASYAVDTLATAVRYGGAPVAEQVSSSTMPHLLWQLAKGLAAYREQPQAAAAATVSAGAAAAAAAAAGKEAAAGGAVKGVVGPKEKAGAAAEAASGRSAAAGPAGPKGAQPKPPRKSPGVMKIQDPMVAASVAAAVAELARAGLLPEGLVPRWRDWLLDVLCADGFDAAGAAGDEPGPGSGAGGAAQAAAAWQAATSSTGRRHAATLEALGVPAAGSGGSGGAGGPAAARRQAIPPWLVLPTQQLLLGAGGPAEPGQGGAMPAAPGQAPMPLVPGVVQPLVEREGGREPGPGAALGLQAGSMQWSVVAALAALSNTPGNHGLQAAHYWLSRLLGELAARTLPYTSLVYAEGPRNPQDLVHCVPVLPSYVRTVADALERAADAVVAEDTPPLPLEFELAGSGLVSRPLHDEARKAAAYRQAAHVVDVVVAERKASDALEALCAIVAPDPDKQRWLLARGLLPLMHRLTRTPDDPRVPLTEAGQPGAEEAEWQEAAAAAAAAVAQASAAATAVVATAAPPPPVSELMSDHEGGPSLCLQRQVARMLAMVAMLPEAQPAMGAAELEGAAAVNTAGGWVAWLRHAATSSDCRLSSNATRALLHVAALNANAAAVAAAAAGAAAAAVRPATAPPVFLDGLHLLDPSAPHHWALVHQAATASAATNAAALAAAAVAVTPAAAGARAASPQRLPAGRRAPGAAVMTAESAASAPPPLPPPVTLASTFFSALSYMLTKPRGLLMSNAAAPPAPPPPPQETVTAATAAEPLQAGTRGLAEALKAVAFSVAASATAAVTGSPAASATPAPAPVPSPHSSQPPSSAPSSPSSAPSQPAAPAQPQPSGIPVAPPAAGLIPVSAAPIYPAPYPPEPEPDASSPKTPSPADCTAPPDVDVVFIHGIRGGPFITWRKAGVMTRGKAASHMERSACWPSTWLAEDFPGARLLSVEYLAPVSAWEGESLPLEDNVSRVMGQLTAAGVGTGQRPVVFVAHSMGGLLVKEMLARSMDQAEAGGGPQAALAASTRGVVFFGTPHFGNELAAMGWRLRHLPGAHPAPSLARLTPGPHLLSVNDRLRRLYLDEHGGLRVVSLLEGQPTQLSGVIPRILIVAPESAYPGFGSALPLPHNDHIDCCKPSGKTAPGYKVVRDLVNHAMRLGVGAGGAGGVKAAANGG